MGNLNKVLLMGNLTRDVETRFTPSGQAVADFGVASHRRFKDGKTNEWREETTFVDVAVWGKQAESAGQHLSKGRLVYIEGHLKYDQWQDKQTGQKRSKLKVVAERVQYLSSANGAIGLEPQRSAGSPASGALGLTAALGQTAGAKTAAVAELDGDDPSQSPPF